MSILLKYEEALLYLKYDTSGIIVDIYRCQKKREPLIYRQNSKAKPVTLLFTNLLFKGR